jgi:hypothetical protein
MSAIIKLLSKFDDSGIRKAKSSFGGLGKALGAVGIGFGIKAIADTLLDAAKAASADAKSTQLLNTQLVKNAGATKAALTQNDKFIETLSLETGIMDDDLRPAMGKLVRATKDVDTAQGLLALSLDAATVAGEPVSSVAGKMAKAFTGNRTALVKLFPTLKESKDLFGDLEKIVGGAAIQQADPFMKLNNSMDILKEKLGVVVLPIITDFIDEIGKPGGAIEVVGKFFDDLANPKSDVGKTFTEIQDAVGEVIAGVGDFFALFGNGNAVEGFKNIATSLIKALPALLALKGIFMLANAGKTVANLVTAMTAISAKSAVPTGDGGPFGWFGKLGPKMLKFLKVAGPLATVATVLSLSGDTKMQTPEEKAAREKELKKNRADLIKNAGTFPGLPQRPTTQNITINVTNADPKATVDALGKYVKQNGSLPFNLATTGKKP